MDNLGQRITFEGSVRSYWSNPSIRGGPELLNHCTVSALMATADTNPLRTSTIKGSLVLFGFPSKFCSPSRCTNNTAKIAGTRSSQVLPREPVVRCRPVYACYIKNRHCLGISLVASKLLASESDESLGQLKSGVQGFGTGVGVWRVLLPVPCAVTGPLRNAKHSRSHGHECPEGYHTRRLRILYRTSTYRTCTV